MRALKTDPLCLAIKFGLETSSPFFNQIQRVWHRSQPPGRATSWRDAAVGGERDARGQTPPPRPISLALI